VGKENIKIRTAAQLAFSVLLAELLQLVPGHLSVLYAALALILRPWERLAVKYRIEMLLHFLQLCLVSCALKVAFRRTQGKASAQIAKLELISRRQDRFVFQVLHPFRLLSSVLLGILSAM
jgi:hypothetical protein